MLLIILALFWVAVLAPTVVRRFRDNGTERSIDSFHAEHQVLSRQEYTVAPAHRLDQDGRETTIDAHSLRKPRLTVVHADDTYGSLESRGTWDEWSEDYNYDDEPTNRRESSMNRYAAAYSSVPSATLATPNRATYEPVGRRRSMKAQRKMIFGRLALSAVALSIIAFVSGMSLLTDVAIALWVCVVAFVALALYAVSQVFRRDVRWPRFNPSTTNTPRSPMRSLRQISTNLIATFVGGANRSPAAPWAKVGTSSGV
jgi:hypothetical protein